MPSVALRGSLPFPPYNLKRLRVNLYLIQGPGWGPECTRAEQETMRKERQEWVPVLVTQDLKQPDYMVGDREFQGGILSELGLVACQVTKT